MPLGNWDKPYIREQNEVYARRVRLAKRKAQKSGQSTALTGTVAPDWGQQGRRIEEAVAKAVVAKAVFEKYAVKRTERGEKTQD